MYERGFRSRRGWVLGALASASLLSACGILPEEQQGEYVIPPGTPRGVEELGYNETIEDLPTSIDPRTPEAMGTPGRSLREDLGERALREEREAAAIGGAGEDVEMPEHRVISADDLPGVGDEAMYGGSGAPGAAALPRQGTIAEPDPGPPAQAPDAPRLELPPDVEDTKEREEPRQ